MSDVTEASLLVVGESPERRRGRPRVDTQSIRVSTWLPEPEYDRLCKLAFKYDMKVSAVLRFMLTQRTPK